MNIWHELVGDRGSPMGHLKGMSWLCEGDCFASLSAADIAVVRHIGSILKKWGLARWTFRLLDGKKF